MKKFLLFILIFPILFTLEAKPRYKKLKFGSYLIEIRVDEENLSRVHSRVRFYNRENNTLHQEFHLDEIIAYTQVSRHGRRKIFFFESFYPTEVSGGSFLNYVIESNGKMKVTRIERPWKNLVIRDVSKNGFQEIFFMDHQYYQLRIDDCLNNGDSEDPKWIGRLVPVIFEFKEGAYEKKSLQDSVPYLVEYTKVLEKQISKTQYKNDYTKLKDFIHYYYVSALVRRKGKALKFIRLFDDNLRYTCREYTPKRDRVVKSLSFQTTIYDFILKYKKDFRN
ncbi:MAG: hypothetical protein KDK54_16100 [Leptospiraceae bacterium]|nr:hypothetical protein [Leptospiraceae bacterium]